METLESFVEAELKMEERRVETERGVGMMKVMVMMLMMVMENEEKTVPSFEVAFLVDDEQNRIGAHEIAAGLCSVPARTSS